MPCMELLAEVGIPVADPVWLNISGPSSIPTTTGCIWADKPGPAAPSSWDKEAAGDVAAVWAAACAAAASETAAACAAA